MVNLFEEGVKLAGISFYFGIIVICTAKARKMREFLGAQSSVQRQKAQLVNFKGMQLKKELCHFTRLVFLHWQYPKHMVRLLRYGLVSQEWSI